MKKVKILIYRVRLWSVGHFLCHAYQQFIYEDSAYKKVMLKKYINQLCDEQIRLVLKLENLGYRWVKI